MQYHSIALCECDNVLLLVLASVHAVDIFRALLPFAILISLARENCHSHNSHTYTECCTGSLWAHFCLSLHTKRSLSLWFSIEPFRWANNSISRYFTLLWLGITDWHTIGITQCGYVLLLGYSPSVVYLFFRPLKCCLHSALLFTFPQKWVWVGHAQPKPFSPCYFTSYTQITHSLSFQICM